MEYGGVIYLDLLIKHPLFCEMFFDPTQVRLVMAIVRNKSLVQA